MGIGVWVLLLGGIISAPPRAVLQHETQNPSIKQQAERLIQSASEPPQTRSSLAEYEKAFWETFPSSFAEFNALFGYNRKAEATVGAPDNGPIIPMLFAHKQVYYEQKDPYKRMEDYVHVFFKLQSIDQRTLYNRIIDIACEGRWNTGLVSLFQHKQRAVVLENLEQFCALLAKRNNEVIQGFWRFYFDGPPHTPKKIPEALHRLKETDLRMYKIIVASAQQVSSYTASEQEVTMRSSPSIKQKGINFVNRAEELCWITSILEKSEQRFFELFPNSFELFNAFFGYKEIWKSPQKEEDAPLIAEILTDSSQLNPLYSKKDCYGIMKICINTFFSLYTIDRTQFYNRIIDIAHGGRWGADLTNWFQHKQREVVLENLEPFCTVLAARSDAEIQGFWFFYFDGARPPKQIPDEMQAVKIIDAHMYQLMEAALQATLQHTYQED